MANEKPEREGANCAFLQARTVDELRALQAAYPLVINDPSNPKYVFNRMIWNEGRRRKLW
jgi:hypothetical protein